MTFRKDKLLYDISNLAYIIADVNSGEGAHRLHQTADICEAGNLDRVARMLGLAFAVARQEVAPLLAGDTREFRLTDFSEAPRDYTLDFDRRYCGKRLLQLFQTLIHEFMVCHVIADFLTVTLPSLSEIWRRKAQLVLQQVKALTEEAMTDSALAPGRLVRPLSPF